MNAATAMPQSEMDSPDPLLSATLDLERCARVLDLETWIVERLKHCEQETTVNFVLAEDGGQAHTATGMVARHSSFAGRMAVPFHVSRKASRNSVAALAMRMSWLSALFGVHFGGGAAALVLDPEKHGEVELRRAVTGFAQHAKETLGSAGVIFPQGVHSVEMDWLEAALGEESAGIVSGRSSLRIEAEYREELVTGLMELVRCASGNLKQRVAVQGFENNDVRLLAKQLLRKGARIVAVADESGGVRHALGMDPELLQEHAREHGMLLGYPEADAVLNADVLEGDCDVLVLAGDERQINSKNAHSIGAKVIVEVTPGAITGTAVHILSASDKVVVPAMLCQGAVLLRAVAEVEEIGSGERRSAWIRRQIREGWRNVVSAAQRWNLSVADAALGLGIQRVAAMVRAQGI